MQVSPLAWRRLRLHPLLWLLPGSACVIALYADHARKASLSIEGQRWFWLDDDQMISMRYARNLAEGHGLVWNPGEYERRRLRQAGRLSTQGGRAVGKPHR